MSQSRTRTSLLILVALGLSSAPGLAAARDSQLLVAAAASLRELTAELADDFERANPGVELSISLGASRALARQIRLGAPIDLFLSADDAILDELEADGFVATGERVRFARNRLVVMRAPGVQTEIRSTRDLLAEGDERIAIASKAAPLGRYTRAWLAGQAIAARLEERFVITEHARAALAAVDLGQVEFAIVYASDARAAKRASIAFPIPIAEQPDILYGAAPIRRSKTTSTTAKRLIDRLAAPETRDLLKRHGFIPTEPGA